MPEKWGLQMVSVLVQHGGGDTQLTSAQSLILQLAIQAVGIGPKHPSHTTSHPDARPARCLLPCVLFLSKHRAAGSASLVALYMALNPQWTISR